MKTEGRQRQEDHFIQVSRPHIYYLVSLPPLKSLTSCASGVPLPTALRLEPAPTCILSTGQAQKPLGPCCPGPLLSGSSAPSYSQSYASNLLTQRLLNITPICRKYAKTVYVWELKYIKLSHQAVLCFSKRYMLRPAGITQESLSRLSFCLLGTSGQSPGLAA